MGRHITSTGISPTRAELLCMRNFAALDGPCLVGCVTDVGCALPVRIFRGGPRQDESSRSRSRGRPRSAASIRLTTTFSATGAVCCVAISCGATTLTTWCRRWPEQVRTPWLTDPRILKGTTCGVRPIALMVPLVRFERTTYRLPYHFGFRRLSFVVWTIP